MNHVRTAILLVLLLISLSRLTAAEVTVFAAASVSDALKQIGTSFTQSTGNYVRFNFGASGALARQIREGAPADVFVSADEMRMDQLEKEELLVPATRQPLVANTLVLVVAIDTTIKLTQPAQLTDASIRRVAMGEPATVPAGTYAKQYLESLGIWTNVASKSVFLDNVRTVLAAVESGNVDAGFVYRTDALISKQVRVAYEVPAAEGPRITYPVAVVKGTKNLEAARSFVAHLASEEAQAIFAQYGFLPARSEASAH